MVHETRVIPKDEVILQESPLRSSAEVFLEVGLVFGNGCVEELPRDEVQIPHTITSSSTSLSSSSTEEAVSR